jgi:hypothetical protein
VFTVSGCNPPVINLQHFARGFPTANPAQNERSADDRTRTVPFVIRSTIARDGDGVVEAARI